MAANTHMSIASWNLALNAALRRRASPAASIEIYDFDRWDGPARLLLDVAVTTQVLLATLTFGATAFGAAASGVKTANSITGGTAVATGTATWFRCYKTGGSVAVLDGSAGTSGTDMILATASIVTGISVTCSAMTISMPVGQ